MNHPADVARLMRPQEVRCVVPTVVLRRIAQQRRNRAHRLVPARLPGSGQPAEHCADLGARARVERRERAPPVLGQRQRLASSVRGGSLLVHQTALLEAAKNAAQVAFVEREPRGEHRGRRRFARGGPVRELVEHAHARQGERAVEQVLAQHADPLRIEAIESPHRRDVLLETEVCLRHRYLQELLLVGANSFARFRPVTPRPNEFGLRTSKPSMTMSTF